jgi:uncharacterized protein
MTQLENISAILKSIAPELVEKYNVSSLGLFGSVVRSDFSILHSDIDILVDFSKPVGIEFIDLANFLEAKINRKVDLVSKKGVKPGYLTQIENDLIYVYKAA